MIFEDAKTGCSGDWKNSRFGFQCLEGNKA
jgi:hypothetical protein